jgi:ubiquinone/menaquinone biosynthesis C-methylase UbiE
MKQEKYPIHLQENKLSNEIINYYTNCNEKERLAYEYSIEKIRSQEIISRYLSKDNLKILDIGGANGVYSFWLAALGHEVDLIDMTPKHIEQAKDYERANKIKLRSMTIGDACSLPFDDNTYDIVLLMGPIYHLQDRAQRIKALLEAKRVLKSNGIIFIAAVSRYSAMLDGYKFDLIEDSIFRKIFTDDVRNGNHTNFTGKEKYFTTSFFHHPDELKSEIEESGIDLQKILSVEGFTCCITDLDNKLKNEQYREWLLDSLRQTEEESPILGMGNHFLAIGIKND